MNTRYIFPFIAIVNGGMIAIMILFNSILGMAVGNTFSILVIQLSGLTLSLAIVAVTRPEKDVHAPAYLRIGGVLGVPIVLLNSLCFQTIGASLTLAGGVLGQSIGSLTADVTGFLGVKKYRFEREKIIGFSVCFAGIIIMAFREEISAVYILLAITAGVITIIQMILNSQLALKIGLMRSTRNNFIGGAAASLILCLVLSVSLKRGFISLLDTPFHYVVGGGWLGVLVVYACNWILPKIPTIYSALLLFSGQIITAIIIDTIRFETFSWNQLAGALLILAGMMYNIRIDVRKEQRSAAEQIIK